MDSGNSNVKRWLGYFFTAVISGMLFLAILPANKEFILGDSDYYYHIALSKKTSEQGLIRKLPQVEDLGWGEYFPDKEFLFHALGGIAYKLGGENAVGALPMFLTVCIIVILVLTANQFTTFPIALASVLLTVFASNSFLFRLSLLRPHLLAVLFFSLILLGISKRSKVLLFIGTVAYCLSYHAFYVPLIPIILSLIFERENRAARSLAYWAFAGLLVGITVNPYFPSNILMGFRHLLIALHEAGDGAQTYGYELLPLRADFYFITYFSHWLVCLAALYTAVKGKFDNKTLMVILGPIFLLMTALNPRATEYATPAAAIALAIFLAHSSLSKKVVYAVCFVAIVALSFSNYKHYRGYSNVPQQELPIQWASRMLTAVEAIPDQASGKKVFNVDWDVSPFLMYKKPEMRFVDILDPSFLKQKNPELFALRNQLTSENTPDPYYLISHSIRPLSLILKAGLFISIGSFGMVGYILYRYFTAGITVTGWTGLIVSIGISTGVIISLLGVIGVYVGKIYLEVKGRPLYLIKEIATSDGNVVTRAS